MPLKRGGGNHMQLYDSRNGEYTEQEKQKMRSYDSFALRSYKWNGENNKFKFHFPLEGIHEKEYCIDFVECVRDDIREPIYDESKMNYLFTFRQKNDKSKFIKGLGYSESNPYKLFHDICLNTERDTISFSKFSYGTVLLTAITTLKGKEIRTVWKLDENLNLYFVTLIPGGLKHGKN